MTNLFEEDTSAAFNAALVSSLTEAYRKRLLLNPPTPSFNTNTNPNAEKFAGFANKKDVTRFLAVLGDLGLTITQKESNQ